MPPTPNRSGLVDPAGQPPLHGAILVGGVSRRMGCPKQLLERGGRTFVELVHDALRGLESVTLIGDGPVPPALAGVPRLPDAPGIRGPLAGIAAALRARPDAAWIVAACDQPLLSTAAVEWLAAQRAPGRWFVLPRTPDGRAQPMPAVYDGRALGDVEDLVLRRGGGPSALADHERAFSPEVPAHLAAAWTSVNTREELDSLPPA